MHHAAVRGVFEWAEPPIATSCILDTEASLEHLLQSVARGADALLAVVEPYPRSLLTGLRTIGLARQLGIEDVSLLANKVRSADEEATVHEYATAHGLPVAGMIPEDRVFHEAELAGQAPVDLRPESPAVKGVAALADTLAARLGGSVSPDADEGTHSP